MRLNNRVAVITGAGSGIGRSAAERFAKEGAKSIVLDLKEESIGPVVEDIKAAGGQAAGYQLDVSDRDQVQDVMKRVAGEHGGIDILINNAGISRYRPFATMTGEDWDPVIDVDLKGVFFCSQAVAPFMIERRYGRIVNISSALGTGAAPHGTAGSPGGSAIYASAKAGVIMLTKTLARELGPHDITVNCIAPGTFLTGISSTTRSPEEVKEHLEYRKKTLVMGRLGTLEELSGAILFFASDDSSYVTGQTMMVDGGRTDRM